MGLLSHDLGVLSDTGHRASFGLGLRVGLRSGTKAEPGLKVGVRAMFELGPWMVPEPNPGASQELRLGVIFGSSWRIRPGPELRAILSVEISQHHSLFTRQLLGSLQCSWEREDKSSCVMPGRAFSSPQSLG
jgi:hypothetical protein